MKNKQIKASPHIIGKAKWDIQTGTGTYSDKIHHGEVSIGSVGLVFCIKHEPQNLVDDKGVSGAKRIMSGKK